MRLCRNWKTMLLCNWSSEHFLKSESGLYNEREKAMPFTFRASFVKKINSQNFHKIQISTKEKSRLQNFLLYEKNCKNDKSSGRKAEKRSPDLYKIYKTNAIDPVAIFPLVLYSIFRNGSEKAEIRRFSL